jgi:EAL and modified HD-GYP domain-containing signal transduction protein
VTDQTTTHAEPEKGIADVQPEPAGELRYVARQPILDKQGLVHGYDLIFRNPPEAIFRRDGDSAVEAMLDNEMLFGLEHLTNHLPAFVTCSAEAITDNLVMVLTPGLTVLGVPSSLDPTPRLIEACRTLRARGFRISLDDFRWPESLPEPLLALVQCADYIRTDFRQFGPFEQQQFGKLGLTSVSLVGQKVETQEDYQQAVAAGFKLFQGGYFCNPVLLKKRKIPANRLFHFEIVRELYRDPIDIRKVSQLLRSDASLTFRLLRLVNSPIYSLRQEVRSIETAIMILGEEAFRRSISLAILSEMNAEQPVAVLHLGLLRARFCELAARNFHQDASEQYLLGLFSLLPAMLHIPMEEIVPCLPLRSQICEALTGVANSERSLLCWIEAHERGDWTICDRIASAHGLHSSQLMVWYEEALIWAASASPGMS